MSDLQLRPFYGYGYRRVHVYTGDGRHVGWFDPNSDSFALELEEFRDGFTAAVATWAAEHPRPEKLAEKRFRGSVENRPTAPSPQ